MRLKNTSRYPMPEIIDLVAFSFGELWAAPVAVHVKNSSRAYVGRAYNGVPSISPAAQHDEVRWLVTIGIGSPGQFPVDNMSMSWKYHAWQHPDAQPPEGYDPRRWGRRRRRHLGGFEVRYLEPVRHPYGGKRSPLIVMNDWREALVAVAAHEARHLWQFEEKARRSEVDAERFAAERLQEYRLRADLPPQARGAAPCERQGRTHTARRSN